MIVDQNTDIPTRPCADCYLCRNQGALLYNGMRDHLFSVPGMWAFRKCSNPDCGLVWLDPMPLEKFISKAYQIYYTHRKYSLKEISNMINFLKSKLQLAYNLLLRATPIHRERRKLNLMYLDNMRTGRLLDVGCGDGYQLSQLRALGWEVEGQELDPKAAAHARDTYNLSVHLGVLKDLAFPDAEFDAVSMRHVIEHVHDPVALLIECKRILKSNGTLVCITPNVESFGHKHFGSSWRGLEPPRHLYLFSPKTLAEIAVRAGFNKYEIWTTAANAQTVAAGSFDIKYNGQHSAFTYLSSRFAASFVQLLAQIIYIAKRNSGEECVLKAIK